MSFLLSKKLSFTRSSIKLGYNKDDKKLVYDKCCCCKANIETTSRTSSCFIPPYFSSNSYIKLCSTISTFFIVYLCIFIVNNNDIYLAPVLSSLPLLNCNNKSVNNISSNDFNTCNILSRSCISSDIIASITTSHVLSTSINDNNCSGNGIAGCCFNFNNNYSDHFISSQSKCNFDINNIGPNNEIDYKIKLYSDVLIKIIEDKHKTDILIIRSLEEQINDLGKKYENTLSYLLSKMKNCGGNSNEHMTDSAVGDTSDTFISPSNTVFGVNRKVISEDNDNIGNENNLNDRIVRIETSMKEVQRKLSDYDEIVSSVHHFRATIGLSPLSSNSHKSYNEENVNLKYDDKNKRTLLSTESMDDSFNNADDFDGDTKITGKNQKSEVLKSDKREPEIDKEPYDLAALSIENERSRYAQEAYEGIINEDTIFVKKMLMNSKSSTGDGSAPSSPYPQSSMTETGVVHDLFAPGSLHYQKPVYVHDPLLSKSSEPNFYEGEEDSGSIRTENENFGVKKSKKQAEIIKSEFISSWNAYKKYAWGKDELKPVSKSYKNWGGSHSKGIALTAIDSLSTLYIMGLHDEFLDAVKFITESVDFTTQNVRVSVFEATIRIVGGLLSAYELSGETIPELLNTTVSLVDNLLYSFNTSSGIPHSTVNLLNHRHWSSDWTGGASTLAEFASLQLEFRTLSYHTRDPKYDIIATHLMDILESRCERESYLCGTLFDVQTAEVRDIRVSFGSNGDSYYEYLLKQYLLTGQTEERYKVMSIKALDAAINRMLRYSNPSRQAYFLTFASNDYSNEHAFEEERMEHLTCFIGGLYALAAHTFPEHSQVKAFKNVAADITDTCYSFYTNQLTGISPESVYFPSGGDFTNEEPYYILRPETIESIFYLWRFTKNQKYRDMAWDIFIHIRAHCKVSESGGYSSIRYVGVVPPEFDDKMESFWLSETLKYLYLIFADDNNEDNTSPLLSLDEWVFNTEAHPLKIRKRNPMDIWTDWEQSHDGVPAFIPPTVPGIEKRTETEKMKETRGNDPVIYPIDELGSDGPPGDEIEYDEYGEVLY